MAFCINSQDKGFATKHFKQIEGKSENDINEMNKQCEDSDD